MREVRLIGETPNSKEGALQPRGVNVSYSKKDEDEIVLGKGRQWLYQTRDKRPQHGALSTDQGNFLWADIFEKKRFVFDRFEMGDRQSETET